MFLRTCELARAVQPGLDVLTRGEGDGLTAEDVPGGGLLLRHVQVLTGATTQECAAGRGYRPRSFPQAGAEEANEALGRLAKRP